MRLLLIRHAEARRGCALNPDCPAPDEGLTPHGREQALTLARYLRASEKLLQYDEFFSSPLPRASQTAEILSSGLELPIFKKLHSLSEVCELPGTDRRESLSEAFARVEKTLASLAEEHKGKRVLAISHSGFILASVLILLAVPMSANRARLDPDYTSFTEWSFSEGMWRLERYNVLPTFRLT